MRIRYRIQTKVTVRREIRYRATYTVRPTYTPVPQLGPVAQLSLPPRTTARVIRTADGVRGAEMLRVEPPSEELDWDVFICHASEDKEAVVLGLVTELRNRGINPWVDETVMRIGDSIRQRIDHGLAHSRFGIVVLSPAFFATKKKWTRLELDALVALETSGRQRILPIWHGLSTDEILSYSPLLAGKVAARTSEATIREIAEEIAEVIRSA